LALFASTKEDEDEILSNNNITSKARISILRAAIEVKEEEKGRRRRSAFSKLTRKLKR